MDTSALAAWLYRQYDFSAVPDVRLIRAYTNAVYRVTLPDRQAVLKIYGRAWRTADEVLYEIDLITHLARRGLPVVRTIPAADGQTLQQFDGQLAVLFEYAAGEKPQPPFSEELYVRFGQAIGNMHNLSDDFLTHYQRRPIDLTYLIDEPLVLILPLLTDADERSALLKVTTDIKQRILELNAGGLDWGPIHGDTTLDNLHLGDNGEVILYDFDSGGLGWRASDLQGWAVNDAEYQGKYQAFLNGYRSVRKLNADDLQVAPWITLAWDVWSIKVDLDNRVLRQGTDQTAAYLDHQLRQLSSRWDAIK